MVRSVIFATLCLQVLQPVTSAPRRVAITIDDGPVVNEMQDLANFERVSSGLIGALRAEQVPATIFINERQLNVPGQRDARVAVLERWLDAGFELANHTYSHPSLNNVPLWQFGDDVVKGEVITRALLEQRGRTLVWFRYPYLHSGVTADVHQGIMDFLEQRGYRVAPVTIDYADYAFASAYRNQLRAGAPEVAQRIKDAYLAQIDVGFDYAEKASVEVFGAEVAQILLLHCNELNAVTLRESIARMRSRGYKFITLEEAMKDPAYQRPDTFTGPGGSWLTRTATALGKTISVTNARVPDWIGALGRTSASGAGQDWSRFRGPNGSGIVRVANVPTEFGPTKNLLWRRPLPPGHSSPVLQGDRIYLTAFRGEALLTLAIDRGTGRVLWERTAPRGATQAVDKRNNPASPSPAVDDDGVYVFFPDYGLIGYDTSGGERWKLPLGPFKNIYGMGASPIVVGDLVVLGCDQNVGSFLIAVDKRTGRVRWKTERPEARSGHSTPIVWRGTDGRDQIVLPGSFLLTSYDARTGRKLWWVRGLSFEMKSTPVIGGDTIYVNGYGAPVNDPGNKVTVPSAGDVWKTADADANGVLSKTEFPKFTSAFWFDVADLDMNGSLTRDEWGYFRAALDSENGMLAIRLGGSGDVTDTAIRWKYQRSVPQLPSPLLYGGVLYMVNDNGIVTMLEPDTGAVIKQGRLAGAPGAVFASPVAGANKIFVTTEDGAVAVVTPGRDLAVLAVNDLGEHAYATPALAEGRVYLRTTTALYAFGQ